MIATTVKLRELLAAADKAGSKESWRVERDADDAREELEAAAPALVRLVLELSDFAERARQYAQEVQRGTHSVAQGDAHGCGQNIEQEAKAALAAVEKLDLTP